MFRWLLLSGFILVLDQISKWAITVCLPLYEVIELVPFLNLTIIHNKGAAFSLLADAGGWQRWFFAVISTAVSIALLFWLRNLESSARLEAISISLILGGAVGNLVDRVVSGYVVDFLNLYNYFGNYHFPIFNIADLAICVGVVLLLIDNFRH